VSVPDHETPLSPQALVEEAGLRASLAAPLVATLPTEVKNDTLRDLASGLVLDGDAVLAANNEDVEEVERLGLPASVVDRITLTRERLGNIAEGIRAVAAFPDPVGEVLRGQRRPNGLVIQEVRVPLGVVAVIGDGRPNTTIDSISLCLKAGNVLLMLGSIHAIRTDNVVRQLVERAAARNQLPDGAIQLLPTTDPSAREHLSRMSRHVEVLIPHGTKEELRAIRENATVPIVETGAGNCHTFVEQTARLEMAADIAFNAKVQRPGTVNAMETLLVDRPIARQFLPIIGPRMQAVGVELRGCEATRAILPGIRQATEEDWHREYLGLILAVRVVDGLDEAIAHIAKYGGHLSEAIVTQDYTIGKRFCERIDAAAVYINASTRFTDGGEFGLGAELGISTQKLHRRGPIALRALTTWKWIIQGEGQVRD
jgi:glutamate-5-semialdehyde dehydrogenase